MRQQLHLLIVDRERRTALAARFGTRWLLPTIGCHEGARAGPLVTRWCCEHGLAHDAAGQWLGRVAASDIDWLVAIAVRGPVPSAIAALEWIDIGALLNGASVIDYQSWALERCVRGDVMPAVAGPFGNLDWPEQLRAWIVASIASPVWTWTPYRMSAHEVVLGVETARGRVYFKGFAGERASEAFVTGRLAGLAPESFASTLALERAADGTVWWLTAECAGWPSHDTGIVGAALARIQQRLLSSAETFDLIPIDLDSAARWVGGLAREPCACVQQADLPHTWIPMDLDRSNVLVDDGDVRFIDVDDSFAGPAPLAMAAFAVRCGSRAGYHRYIDSWSPPLKGIAWRRLEIAAMAFQAWRGWESLRRNIERGEVHAALDRVERRIRERLARDLHRR